MSHFSVMVRVPSSTPAEGLEEAVRQVLQPYCEHDDSGRATAYFVFKDTEDESRAKYETEGADYIQMPDGAFFLPWDEKFRVPGSFGTGGGSHAVPAGLPRVQRSFKETFATFEAYMAEWCGEKSRHQGFNRYGYLRNPNAKWDYWRIGGRWRGSMYIKPQTEGRPSEGGLGELGYEFEPRFHKGEVPGSEVDVDYCRIRDLDFDRVATDTQSRVDKFWEELVLFFKDTPFPVFEGPRSTMLDVGMLRCVPAARLTGTEFYTKKWNGERDMYDVIDVKPTRELYDVKLRSQLDPIRPYAFVDAEGWREPGTMGWWASTDATPETRAEHGRGFMEWLRAGDQGDWVVIVDCHT